MNDSIPPNKCAQLNDSVHLNENATLQNNAKLNDSTGLERRCALSMIVPVLNDEVPLQRLLTSLRGMRNALWEVIVVDGGSVDHSASIAKRLADVAITSAPGRATQMNAGAAIARGELIWFVHADAMLSVTLLSTLTRVSQHPCWGRCDVRLDHRAGIFRLIERMMNWRSTLTGIATGDQGIFISRDTFIDIGGYASIPLMEDVELSARLRRHMKPLCIRTPILTSSRRWVQHGITRTIFLMWWLRLLYVFGVSPQRLHRIYYGANFAERFAQTSARK